MDADLQNDPDDIPALVEKLNEGYEVVSGWRKDRKDSLLRRKIPSWFANKIISILSGTHLHDYGCTLKAYRASWLKRINLYGEMHRFIPALVAHDGGRVTEIVVQHHPRTKGKSKYGLERVLKVTLDLILIKFIYGYATRPLHFFGRFSILCFAAGGAVGLYTMYYRYIGNIPGINLLPLVLLSMLLLLLGAQTLFMGLLAEIASRTYYEAQDKKTYVIEQIVRKDPQA